MRNLVLQLNTSESQIEPKFVAPDLPAVARVGLYFYVIFGSSVQQWKYCHWSLSIILIDFLASST